MFPKNMFKNNVNSQPTPMVERSASEDSLPGPERNLLETVSGSRRDGVARAVDYTLRIAAASLQAMAETPVYDVYPAQRLAEQWQTPAQEWPQEQQVVEPQVVLKTSGPYAVPTAEAQMPVYTGGNDDPSGLMTAGLEYATYKADPANNFDDAVRSQWAASGNSNGNGDVMHGSISEERLSAAVRGSDGAELMDQAAWVSGLKDAVQPEQSNNQEWAANRTAYDAILTANLPPQQAAQTSQQEAARAAVAGAFGAPNPANPYFYEETL
jgi:hypothetical protein